MTIRPAPSPGGARRAPALAALVVVCAASVSIVTDGRVFGQTFRSSVDLIAVDVQVIDRSGHPVLALGAEDFEVTLDGRRRPVVSVTFTRHDVAPPPPEPRVAMTPHPGGTTSAPALDTASLGAGRTFIISIDTASFRTLDANVAILAAQRFMRQLSPDDAVGVFTLPYGRPQLAPTTSHATVRQMLGTIVGGKPMAPGQFDMTVEQVIDITAAAASLSLLDSRRTVGQMFSDQTVSDDQMDCAGIIATCTESALSDAQAWAHALEEEVIQGLAGLDSLLRLLQGFPGRKTVLLLSGGMPVSDRLNGRPALGTEVKRLGEQAAYANATIHTLYFDSSLNASFSAESRSPRGDSGRHRVIYTRALAEFSEPSGGTLTEVSTGAGEAEIDRLVAQASTYYILGIEPDARDRDGRPHRLQVKVARRDVNIRSRQLVIIPRAGP
jgi:VWFA-related protein